MWLQRLVQYHRGLADRLVLTALGEPTDGHLRWKSPLPPIYNEYRDGAALTQLEIANLRVPLREFWPPRGPVWDGLAISPSGARILVEAKAHIPEMISAGCKAEETRLNHIQETLLATKKLLAPRSQADWTGPFFQYANRLAFLRFLRELNDCSAHLVLIYFTYDTEIGETTESEYRGAIRLMDACLGLANHRLASFVHKLFVDVRDLTTPGA